MPEMTLTKEQFEELKKIETEYQKILSEKQQAERDALEKEKVEKIVADIIGKMHPKEKKIVWTPQDAEKDKDAEFKNLGEFLKMVAENDPRISHFRKTAMSTTSGQGGYTIPTELTSEIIAEINNESDVVSKFTDVTINEGLTLNPTSVATDITMAWSTEATDKSTTKPTFSRDSATIRFLYAIVKRTKELALGSISDIPRLIQTLVAENIALELELQGLQANAAPFTGVLNAVGVNAVAQAGANLAYSDLTAVVNNAGQLRRHKKGAQWVVTLGGLNIIMTLQDNQNRPLWNLNAPLDGKPSSILGYNYDISDQITDTTGAGGTTSMVFGNLKHIWLAKHRLMPNLNVLYSETAVISSGTSVSENFFTQNLDGWRFEIARALLVAVPAAFVKLTGVK